MEEKVPEERHIMVVEDNEINLEMLLDMRMPVMGGLEATRKLREIPKFADIPIVALTVSTGTDAEEKQIDLGCTAHLPKPIQTKELFGVLTKYLGS